MPVETEHKYLVDRERWKSVIPGKSLMVRQGYLLTDPGKTVRVRTAGDRGYLTIKGKTVGASRDEFEYEIPVAEARELISRFCSAVIEKTRHLVVHEGKTWEVDEFHGANQGLMIAEIELDREDESYPLPDWAGENVTEDARYFNASLVKRPYTTW